MPDTPLRKWCHAGGAEHLHYFTAKGPLCGKRLVATKAIHVDDNKPYAGKKPPCCRECLGKHTQSWKQNIDPQLS